MMPWHRLIPISWYQYQSKKQNKLNVFNYITVIKDFYKHLT